MASFRRRIEIAGRHTSGSGHVRAVLEDDFHHFRVALRYRDGSVSDISGEAPRHPFSACPEATAMLDALLGMPLNRIANAVTRFTDATQQCTHMFDLAGIAISVAAQGITHRVYEIEVPRHIDGLTEARLDRDDGFRLAWQVNESNIIAPPPYAGINMREGMARWALNELAEDEAEAALVLRRCALIALGRRKDIDKEAHAHLTGRCYAQQPHRARHAIRIMGSTWDFSDQPEALCKDDHAWLKDFSPE